MPFSDEERKSIYAYAKSQGFKGAVGLPLIVGMGVGFIAGREIGVAATIVAIPIGFLALWLRALSQGVAIIRDQRLRNSARR